MLLKDASAPTHFGARQQRGSHWLSLKTSALKLKAAVTILKFMAGGFGLVLFN